METSTFHSTCPQFSSIPPFNVSSVLFHPSIIFPGTNIPVRMLIENNETFLSELTKLFNANRVKGGSLYITMKRWDGRTRPIPAKRSSRRHKPVVRSRSNGVSGENKCLLRAQIGDKRISTVISAKDVNKFQLAYANLLKGNLLGLKKKDKKKSASSKTNA